jgi:hypothetical protein
MARKRPLDRTGAFDRVGRYPTAARAHPIWLVLPNSPWALNKYRQM